jgi:hypothetical protein
MQGNSLAYQSVRWVSLVWLLTWFPTNCWVWGWQNMLHFCDIAVVVACLGLWLKNALLVSGPTLNAIPIGILWTVDVAWRLMSGHHLVGGTEYMWDAHYALWVRLLSVFHTVMPFLLLWAIAKLGYDRRALSFQAWTTAVLLIFSRFLPRELNMNYAFQDPLFHRAWGPAPVHLTVIFAVTVVVFYLPTHCWLSRVFRLHGEFESR